MNSGVTRIAPRDPVQGRATFELLRSLFEIQFFPEEEGHQIELKGELANNLPWAVTQALGDMPREKALWHAFSDAIVYRSIA